MGCELCSGSLSAQQQAYETVKNNAKIFVQQNSKDAVIFQSFADGTIEFTAAEYFYATPQGQFREYIPTGALPAS